jgi:hypothetical protein
VRCPTCHGDKRIRNPDSVPGCEPEWVTCPRCGGTGEIALWGKAVNREELRYLLLSDIDKALQHTWVIPKDEQARLRAVRELVKVNDAVIDLLLPLLDKYEREGETMSAPAPDALPGTPYPASLPLAEATDVVNYVRGTMTDRGTALHSAWVVAGYGLSQWQPVPMTSPESAGPLGREQLAEKLEAAVKVRREGGVEKTAIPWVIIIPALIQLVLDILKARQGDYPWERPPGEK